MAKQPPTSAIKALRLITLLSITFLSLCGLNTSSMAPGLLTPLALVKGNFSSARKVLITLSGSDCHRVQGFSKDLISSMQKSYSCSYPSLKLTMIPIFLICLRTASAPNLLLSKNFSTVMTSSQSSSPKAESYSLLRNYSIYSSVISSLNATCSFFRLVTRPWLLKSPSRHQYQDSLSYASTQGKRAL